MDREYIFTIVLHMLLVVSVVCAPDEIHEVTVAESFYEKDLFSVHIDVFITIGKIFILVLYTLDIETSRSFSNVLENFQKKRKNFVANLIITIFLKFLS